MCCLSRRTASMLLTLTWHRTTICRQQRASGPRVIGNVPYPLKRETVLRTVRVSLPVAHQGVHRMRQISECRRSYTGSVRLCGVGPGLICGPGHEAVASFRLEAVQTIG